MWRVFLYSSEKMKSTKLALSFEQQAERLLERGFIAPNKEELTQRLGVNNHYRLSAHWYPFKWVNVTTREERLAPGTTFEMIWR